MHNEFTAIVEQEEGWYIAYSPEVPNRLARKICKSLSIPEIG